MFIPDWRKVLRYALSVRYMAAAILFSGLEVGLPYLEGTIPVPPRLFALLASGSTMLAFYYRFKAQKEFKNADQ